MVTHLSRNVCTLAYSHCRCFDARSDGVFLNILLFEIYIFWQWRRRMARWTDEQTEKCHQSWVESGCGECRHSFACDFAHVSYDLIRCDVILTWLLVECHDYRPDNERVVRFMYATQVHT